MTYNLTGLSHNTTNMISLMQGVNNEFMLGTLGLLIVIGISAVVFIAAYSSTADAKRAGITTAFVTFITSMLMRAMGMLDSTRWTYLSLVALALGIAFMFRKG